MKKVLIGMSGGVDSAVAAVLLKEQGYEVIGATMRLWDPAEVDAENESRAIQDARGICEKLAIPFHVFDYRALFKEQVLDYFVDAYTHGKTPNPCVACNKHLKFGAFFEKAKELGLDYIATGHYAKIEQVDGKYQLRMSDAMHKDQSYFLYHLNQDQLAHTLMPLGNYTKEQVRKIAEEQQLVVANKPESMDICFVENGDYRAFIKEYASVSPAAGDILDTEGHVIGQHKGLLHYTVGQRKGIGAYGKPMFVLRIDAEKNALVLGEQGMEYDMSLVAGDVHFVSGEPLIAPRAVTAKARYQASPEPATIYPEGDRVRVEFMKPQRAVTPGQSVVFYDGDIVLGGGIVQ